MITVSIDLSKVPKEQIVEKNGKKYLNIVVDNRKEPDQYGNTHTVYMSQSKDDRTNKAPKTYIGSAKEFVFNQQPVQQQPVYHYDANNPPSNNEPSDIPF